MLRGVKQLERYAVHATDGDIGHVRDFLFDDEHWTIRYLVIDTGGFWLGPVEVLVSPIAFREVDWQAQRFNLGLTREKVKNSPSINTDRPVARQDERNYHQYFEWPRYWGYDTIWGAWNLPSELATRVSGVEPERATDDDPHLRSAREVTGYSVHGSDREIGHVSDFMVDDATWTLRYLVLDTNRWWFGKHILLPPLWIERVSWIDASISVRLPREIVKTSPEWTPGQPIDRDYERRLYAHYGHKGYWDVAGTDSVGY